MRRTIEQARADLDVRYRVHIAKKRQIKKAFFKGSAVFALFLVSVLIVIGVALPDGRQIEMGSTTSTVSTSQNDLNAYESESVPENAYESESVPENSLNEPKLPAVEYVIGKNLMAGIKPISVTIKQADDTFVRAQMEFAVHLFKQSCLEKKSTLVSPLSAQLCLAMIANGAAGETLSEMEQVLGGGLSLEQINEYLPAYAYGLPSSDIVSLQINNAIWFTEGYPIRKDFLQTNANYYGAELFQTVFDSASVDEINRWVSENTDGMIEEFIDDIPSETLSVLVNTLLFDGSWENSFDEKESIEAPFITYDGKTQMALMMKSEEQIFLSGKDYKGFLKYYDGRDYAFAAIQPEEAIDIFSFVQNLTGDSLLEILRNAKNDTVNIMLPKFNFEYEADLKDTMSSMGMPAAFLPDQADFSAMGDMSVGNIYLQKLIQKTKIEISESGTKAAAVTGGFMGVDSAGNNVFLVRPFVYMIIDTKTNLPIFMGVLTEIPA